MVQLPLCTIEPFKGNKGRRVRLAEAEDSPDTEQQNGSASPLRSVRAAVASDKGSRASMEDKHILRTALVPQQEQPTSALLSVSVCGVGTLGVRRVCVALCVQLWLVLVCWCCRCLCALLACHSPGGAAAAGARSRTAKSMPRQRSHAPTKLQVFDGHGGAHCAAFCQTRLLELITSNRHWPDDIPTSLVRHSAVMHAYVCGMHACVVL